MSECSFSAALNPFRSKTFQKENKETIQTKLSDRPFVFVYNKEIYFLAPGMINQFSLTDDNSNEEYQFIIEN